MAARKVDIMVVSFTGDTGLTDYSASLCRELSKLAVVELVTARSFDEKKYQAEYSVVKLFRRTRQFPIDVFKFIAHVLQIRPKVVLFQSWMKSAALEIPLVLLFKVFGIRTALTIHDLLPHYPKPWSRMMCAAYYSTFDSLIVHSQRQLDGVREMGVKQVPLVVPHGIYDIFNTRSLTKEQGRSAFPNLSNGDFVVLFFGNLDERKGLVEYIHAAKLLEADESIKFLVAGRSDGRAPVTAALRVGRSLGNTLIRDTSVPHDEVQNYFSACDVVALPYLEGTTSGVFKLAMAFGKPVICTDVGDFSESVSAWSGLVIQPINLSTHLAMGIQEIQSNSEDYLQPTRNLSRDMQWDVIAKNYATHLLKFWTTEETRNAE